MAAGESARAVARKRREQIERLTRQAEMFERGAAGEEATGAALDSLKPHGWVHLADVRWPGRQRANIDHVVVGPAGVFVVDSKNWSGTIRVTDGVLRQDGRPRDRAVHGAADAANAVTALLPPYARTCVHPVLCFAAGQDVAGRSGRVMVCSTARVAELLTTRRAVLTSAQVTDLAAVLRSSLPVAAGPREHGRPVVGVPYSAPKQRNKRRRRVRGVLRPIVGLALLLGLAVAGEDFTAAVGSLVEALLQRP